MIPSLRSFPNSIYEKYLHYTPTFNITKLRSMAAFILVFLILSALNAVSPQPPRRSHVLQGSSLTPTANSTWLSPSGLYAFGFFPQNNAYAVGIFLAGIPGKPVVVWTANVNDPMVSNDSVLQLTPQGRLVVQQRGRQDTAIANPNMTISSASMLDNGNFVLYHNNSVAWQSFDSPTDTLLPGQRLLSGNQLISSASDNDRKRGFFRMKMQTDGNLVQYPVNTPDTGTYSYYSSYTAFSGNNVSLNLDADCRLYLLNGTSYLRNITMELLPEGTLCLLRIDVDGISRLYSHPTNRFGNWNVRWESNEDKCAATGLCGFNGFCSLKDNVANCECLPGFEYVQPGNRTAGCGRNFTSEICGEKDSKSMYEMRAVENMAWDSNPYEAAAAFDTVEGCKAACLDDCNCEAAIYSAGQCTKEWFPLRYGRRSRSYANIALIKVRVQTPNGVVGNSTKETKKELRFDILFISIALVIIAALLMGISMIYVHKKRRAYKKVAENSKGGWNYEDVTPQALSYTDLARATNDFAEELGKGSSGTVFKGVLSGTQNAVAVKRLEKESAGEKEFQIEMKTIGKTYHRNLVRLLGYCFEGPNWLLVFEYMSNGSLANVLVKPDRRPCWDDRINIIRDIARGIVYLHDECETQIIHCDIKPQNILMDENGRAKISDFGLAKLIKQDQSNTYTGIRGTRGYVAPEWHRKQPITAKVDVYSFGIVLLEIVCWRRSIDWNLSDNEAVLEEWAYDCYKTREVGKLVGDEVIDADKVERIVKIGIWCIQYEASLRPSMKKVVLMLEGNVDIPLPPDPFSS